MQAKICSVSVVIGIWGEKYIREFLELGLSSLLAPGNIPALADSYKSRVIFLTRKDDIIQFESNPAFQRLKKICDVEFICINDFIVNGNYSTVLTLSFDRAVRAAGEEMLNTYFIFLTSDYVMADGSMEGLIRYIRKGYSCICTGNYQAIEEDIKPLLQSCIDPETHVLQIKPRELVKMSMQYLHPVTTASFYDHQLLHKSGVNRFFKRINSDSFAGRFYLLHMLCIKPETTQYSVGSSCDYSFIPEMCPSGNIAYIADSDDYFVLEVQPRYHESQFIRLKGFSFNKLIYSLAEWTTLQHRKNAQQTIYFHASEISDTDKTVVDSALGQYIARIDAALKKYPVQPHRNHPYWLGAMRAFRSQKKLISEQVNKKFKDIDESDRFSKNPFFGRIYGFSPNHYPWHYHWIVEKNIKDKLKHFIEAQPKQKTLVVYTSYTDIFAHYCHWLEDKIGVDHFYPFSQLSQSNSLASDVSNRRFERCVLMCRFENLQQIKKNLQIISKLLAENASVLVFTPNEYKAFSSIFYNFQLEFVRRASGLVSTDYKILEVSTVTSDMAWLCAVIIQRFRRFFENPFVLMMVSVISLIGGAFFYLWNTLAAGNMLRKGKHVEAVFATLTLEKSTGAHDEAN